MKNVNISDESFEMASIKIKLNTNWQVIGLSSYVDYRHWNADYLNELTNSEYDLKISLEDGYITYYEEIYIVGEDGYIYFYENDQYEVGVYSRGCYAFTESYGIDGYYLVLEPIFVVNEEAIDSLIATTPIKRKNSKRGY